MSVELVKDKIVVEQKIGKEKAQVLLEGDIIVPDIKPDVNLVLKADSKIQMDEMNISDDKISFEGELLINLMYLSKDSEKPIHCMSTTMPIREVVSLENVSESSVVNLDYRVSHIEHKLINDRKISLKAILDADISAYQTKEKEILVDIKNDDSIEFMKTYISVSRSIDNKEDRFIIKDDLKIPAGNPNIREILNCTAKINDKDIRVTTGKIIVKGTVLLNTLYVGDSDESIVEICEHEIPFSGSIDINDAREGMIGDCGLRIESEYVQIRPDDEGEERILEAEFIISAKAKLICQSDIHVIEDAYSINKDLNLIKDRFTYPHLVCTNKNQCTIKETIQLDYKCPPMLQIYQVVGEPIVENIVVEEDKINLEGLIPTDILYVAKDDSTPFYSYRSVIPFNHLIDARGAQENMEVKIDTVVDHISYNMLSDNEIEVRYVISFNAGVTEIIDAMLINSLELKNPSPGKFDNMASIIIYVVQEDDSLWDIAKHYNSSIDDLMKLNDLEDDTICNGQKLLILKKV